MISSDTEFLLKPCACPSSILLYCSNNSSTLSSCLLHMKQPNSFARAQFGLVIALS